MQRIFYFSLRERLEALLKLPQFVKLLQFEFCRPRPRNRNIMTDVFDAPGWRAHMGEASLPCRRIGLQLCSDGFQAFNCGSLSLKPVVEMILSLSPAKRTKSEYMLLHMLLPPGVKNLSQKKYFDFAATFEMNSLWHEGKNFSEQCMNLF